MKPLLLKKILQKSSMSEMLCEDENITVSDSEIVKKNFEDEFVLNDAGLEYVKKALEKLNKKAGKIGVKPLELKIRSTDKQKFHDKQSNRDAFKNVYKIEILGQSPIISGYKFIASLDHTSAGNIINISPDAGVGMVPDEYRTSTPTCDYCHTKRDRNNTFILQNLETKEFLKVGRSCLKNFLPDKNPEQILKYADYISSILEELVKAEKMKSDFFGRREKNDYYDADEFLFFVCAAYLITGRYVSKRMIQQSQVDSNETITSVLAQGLMNIEWQSSQFKDVYIPKLERVRSQAEKLKGEVDSWAKQKNWDQEISKNPDMANFIENIRVILKLDHVNYKSANYHAAVLALYLRERNEKDKKAVSNKNPKNHVGVVGQKIMFIGTLKVFKQFERQKFGYYDSGISYLIIFHDIDNENEIVYFSNNPGDVRDEDVGKSFKVQGTVKKHDYSRQTQTPQTIITRAKITAA
jgi:hypothetical protein